MTKRAPISQKNTATVKDNIDSAKNTTNNCLGAKLQLRASFQYRLVGMHSALNDCPSKSNADASEDAVGHLDEVLADMLRYCFQHCFNITLFSGNNCAF